MANDDGGEKSEEPTAKQFEKAREEGNVAKSKELSSGIILTLMMIFLYFYFPIALKWCEDLFNEFFQFSQFTMTPESTKVLFYTSLLMIGKIVLPFFVFIFVIAVLAEAAQVGLHVSPKALEPKWEKVNFFQGLPKFFQGKRKLVELAKSIFKIIVLGWLAVSIVQKHMPEIVRMTDAEYMDSTIFTGKLIFELMFKLALAVLILGIADFAYQKWQHKQELKMTKQQVKEEYKQMEGDPLIRQRIRNAQREIARKRMMQDVPSADVVVTNPTHYAVALKYDTGGSRPPYVVAKGMRLMALKIKDIARENGIYIHEDPPLAQTLYKTLDIDDDIPENLYKAIAEILAVIYSSKKGKIK